MQNIQQWQYHFLSLLDCDYFGLYLQPVRTETRVCVCKKHDNAQLKCDKLNQLKVLNTKNVEGLLEDMCCSTDNLACMMRNCSSCADKHIAFIDNGAPDTNKVAWME